MWLVILLLWAIVAPFNSGTGDAAQVEPVKEEIVVPEKPYPKGVTNNPWFGVTDAKGVIAVTIDKPISDKIDVKVSTEYSDDGGKTVRVDKNGNPIRGCGASFPASSWVDRQGDPVTQKTVTCKSKHGDGSIKDLPNGVMYRSRIETSDPGQLTVTYTYDKK